MHAQCLTYIIQQIIYFRGRHILDEWSRHVNNRISFSSHCRTNTNSNYFCYKHKLNAQNECNFYAEISITNSHVLSASDGCKRLSLSATCHSETTAKCSYKMHTKLHHSNIIISPLIPFEVLCSAVTQKLHAFHISIEIPFESNILFIALVPERHAALFARRKIQ